MIRFFRRNLSLSLSLSLSVYTFDEVRSIDNQWPNRSLWRIIHKNIIHKNSIDVLSSLSEISMIEIAMRHRAIVIVDGDPVR